MGYTIGVSSGIFSAVESEQKGEFAGLPHKAIFSMFKGVQFNQIDLESVSEFKEPNILKKMEEVRNMGIRYGLHGEVPEYSKAFPKLDSALTDEWRRSHERFVTELQGAADIKAQYILFHSSTSSSFVDLSKDLESSNVCDIWGRRIDTLLKEDEKLFWWTIKQDIVKTVTGMELPSLDEMKDNVRRSLARTQIAEGKKPEEVKLPQDEEVRKMAVKELENEFFSRVGIDHPTYGAERIAYYIVAKWMQEGKDCPGELRALWNDVTNGGDIDDVKFRNKFENWVPAVTAAYHWGHFYPEKCPKKGNIGAADPKPIIMKGKLQVVFETPMGGAGGEESMRLARATHIYKMVRTINNPFVGVAVDAEHMLSANINPLEDIRNLPWNAGEKIFVVHVGVPSPLAPAHIPIMLGSEAQLYVYEIMGELRKKGMKNAIVIFERGGGQEPVKESVLSLRKIVEYLDKDTAPKDLPEDFFGMPAGGPELTRQIVSIREHALEPLKGLLTVPEEEYGFLSSAAAAKGKLEEWRKRELH